MHKILLVEDDQVIRQQVGKMLSEWGFEVVLVEDFMEVLSLFVQSEPHLVLMDIGLPLFNGYHWCQEIRKISKVPIIVSVFERPGLWISLWNQYGGG